MSKHVFSKLLSQ